MVETRLEHMMDLLLHNIFKKIKKVYYCLSINE